MCGCIDKRSKRLHRSNKVSNCCQEIFLKCKFCGKKTKVNLFRSKGIRTEIKKAKAKDLATLSMGDGAMGSDSKPIVNMSQLKITTPWVKGVEELPQNKSTFIPIKEKK